VHFASEPGSDPIQLYRESSASDTPPRPPQGVGAHDTVCEQWGDFLSYPVEVREPICPNPLRSKLMARQDASELLNALAPALQAAAKNALRHAYGPGGLPWGTRFTEVEGLAVQVGQLLSREVLRTAVEGQAQAERPPELRACPAGAGPLQHRPPEQRDVRARPGSVTWQEPATYCPRCRRAFFPPVQEPGP
jgi:hypothetical protein